MALFAYIRHCLTTEVRLLQQLNGETFQGLRNLPPSRGVEVLRNLDILRRRVHETTEHISCMGQEQENFALQYHECTKTNGKSNYNLFFLFE